ncbi:hypothetical protein AYI70_g1483 [Smittium culicis]|uniref:Uncharacterized protein n=1 Tax=Smittium culicis TaxID=133412 RepID=A0A1R1YD44_9FUNG|nr:hypothetical protein AYI70_g1483 [Smittium culicis]
MFLTTNYSNYDVNVDVFTKESDLKLRNSGYSAAVVVSGEAEFHNETSDFNKNMVTHQCCCSIVVPLKFVSVDQLPKNCDYLNPKIYYENDFFIVNFPKFKTNSINLQTILKDEKFQDIDCENVPLSSAADNISSIKVSINRHNSLSDNSYSITSTTNSLINDNHCCVQESSDSPSLNIYTLVGILILVVLVAIYWIDMAFKYISTLNFIPKSSFEFPKLLSFDFGSLFRGSCSNQNSTTTIISTVTAK